MPRAKIPYELIDEKLREMYPQPAFKFVNRDDTPGSTPITVYDRRSGNFRRIGYLVPIFYERLDRFGEFGNLLYKLQFEVVFVKTE